LAKSGVSVDYLRYKFRYRSHEFTVDQEPQKFGVECRTLYELNPLRQLSVMQTWSRLRPAHNAEVSDIINTLNVQFKLYHFSAYSHFARPQTTPGPGCPDPSVSPFTGPVDVLRFSPRM